MPFQFFIFTHMYLRETRQKRADGSLVTHLQLAESVWNPQKKRSEVRILHRKIAGKPRRSRRGGIGFGRAGLDARAANFFLCHSGALNGRWSGEDGNPGIHAGEDVHGFISESDRRFSVHD
jgi:hypothetical protein